MIRAAVGVLILLIVVWMAGVRSGERRAASAPEEPAVPVETQVEPAAPEKIIRRL